MEPQGVPAVSLDRNADTGFFALYAIKDHHQSTGTAIVLNCIILPENSLADKAEIPLGNGVD